MITRDLRGLSNWVAAPDTAWSWLRKKTSRHEISVVTTTSLTVKYKILNTPVLESSIAWLGPEYWPSSCSNSHPYISHIDTNPHDGKIPFPTYASCVAAVSFQRCSNTSNEPDTIKFRYQVPFPNTKSHHQTSSSPRKRIYHDHIPTQTRVGIQYQKVLIPKFVD